MEPRGRDRRTDGSGAQLGRQVRHPDPAPAHRLMRFIELALPGAFLVAPERQTDERGYFARTWCREEFASHGLATDFVQCNTSFNARRGTLRGMHFQRPPHGEI